MYPSSAQAAPTIDDDYPILIHPTTREICPIENYGTVAAQRANRAEYGIIKRMVYCIQGLVIPATYKMMYINSVNYFYGPIAAACTLALLLWGFLMATGKNSAPMKDAFTVALKIGGVFMFTFVLGQSDLFPKGLFPVMLAVVDDLSSIVTTYVGYSSSIKCASNFAPSDMWGRVDCTLNTIFGGIFSSTTLVLGLVGFFVTAFFSSMFGIFIALAGFAIIFFLVFSIFRACYITITAYVAIALMALVSPIFITLLLFKSTYGYFEKWLKLTLGFMLQPIFLFAYLSMMLAAYDTVVYDGRFSIYRALVSQVDIGSYPTIKAYPTDIASNPAREFYIGQWMLDKGVFRVADGPALGVGTNPAADVEMKARNVGVLGSTGAKEVDSNLFDQRDASGIKQNILKGFAALNVYMVDVQINKIGWQEMSLAHLCTTAGCTAQTKYDEIVEAAFEQACPNARGDCLEAGNNAAKQALYNVYIQYMVQLLLSLLIAMLTMYIFYLLIDVLPFIGAGIAGDKYSMPALGLTKNTPGGGLLTKFGTGMKGLVGGGK